LSKNPEAVDAGLVNLAPLAVQTRHIDTQLAYFTVFFFALSIPNWQSPTPFLLASGLSDVVDFAFDYGYKQTNSAFGERLFQHE
jgi:hypothetical protein